MAAARRRINKAQKVARHRFNLSSAVLHISPSISIEEFSAGVSTASVSHELNQVSGGKTSPSSLAFRYFAVSLPSCRVQSLTLPFDKVKLFANACSSLMIENWLVGVEQPTADERIV